MSKKYGYILFPLSCGRVYRQVVCHDVVRFVLSNRLYIISTVVRSGLPTGGLPRCHEVGSIKQVIYYFHGREVGFTDRWFATMS